MTLTTAQRRMLLIGVVPLLLLVIGGAAVTVATIRGKLPFDYAATSAAGPQGVRIFSTIPTQVIGSANSQVRIAVSGTYAAKRPEIETRTVDGVLDIRIACPGAHCELELTVEVPAATAVQAKTQGASLDLSGLAGKLKADTDGGSVTMNRIRSQQVSVDGRRGSVTMQFDDPPEQVTAIASDGSIDLRVPQTTTYTIDAVSAQGSTDILPVNDPAATHHLFLRTSYGSINVN
ncbi:DUF4097 family beta strand repeat-containing protein [Kribbella sp. NPDC051587]|uniref:DUF4097 family beta strand repeat-containing protein n=1 Tax=Kribbella sp. NPDC051587 TaxID=3364119 RepID=UPI0037A930E9